MRTARFLLALLAAAFVCPLASAQKTAEKSTGKQPAAKAADSDEPKMQTVHFGGDKDKQFELQLPESWTVKITRPLKKLPQTLTAYSDSKQSIALLMTPFPPKPDEEVNSERLQEILEAASNPIIGDSVEKKMEPHSLKLPHGTALYATFTDKKLVGKTKLPRGEWAKLTHGVIAIDGTLVNFSLMYNEPDAERLDELLEYFKSLKPASKQPSEKSARKNKPGK